MPEISLETWWALVAGLPVAAVLLLLSARAHRRRGRSWRQISAVIGPRAILLLLLLLLASRPVAVQSEQELRQRNRVALLIDRSASMALVDGPESRYGQAVDFSRERLLPALKQANIGVEPLLFADAVQTADGREIAEATPDGKQTNLPRAIARGVLMVEPAPLAVIALTDGVSTENAENPRAIAALVENGVPLLGIGFGKETGTQILTVEDVTAPSLTPPSQEFQVAVRLRATGQDETPPFDLLLLRDGQLVQQKTVPAGSGARSWQESFAVTESEPGFYRYTIRLVPPSSDSLRSPNTSGTVAVRISEERELRVLFVQGGLTWDYKFIRVALTADPTIRLAGISRVSSQTSFLQTVDSDVPLEGGFPETIEDLARFRVVVLANLRSSDLTDAQQQLLATFCRDLGGGVLMIGGSSSFDVSWHDSRLEQLLPVRFSALARMPMGGQRFRFHVTDDALKHPVFQIGDSGRHREAWSQLPPFEQYASVESVKPGAQVWAVAGATVGPSSDSVLMATQRYGAGRTAVIGVQNFWRWRLARQCEPAHFDRFWQQLLRFLGEGSRDDVILGLPDQAFRQDADVRVVLQRRREPQQGEAASGPEKYRFVASAGRDQTVADQSVELAPGQSIDVTFHAGKAGLYELTLKDAVGGVIATRSVEIRDIDVELLDTARNMETLRQWALLSGGLARRWEEIDDVGPLIDTIRAAGETPKPERTLRQPLGINGWMLCIVLGCLCAEWLLRRRQGMV